MLDHMFDMWKESARAERRKYHVTLGELIEFLKEYLSKDVRVPLAASPMSYRGYYEDISFERGDSSIKEFYNSLCEVLGKELEGYKGGNFKMAKDTPLWVSKYGCSDGVAILGVRVSNGHVLFDMKHVD